MKAFISGANDHIANMTRSPTFCCGCQTFSSRRIIFIWDVRGGNIKCIEVVGNDLTGFLFIGSHLIDDAYNFGLRKLKAGDQFFRNDQTAVDAFTYRYFVDCGSSRIVEIDSMPALKPAEEELHGRRWGQG